MKGLRDIPTNNQLQTAYDHLQSPNKAVSEDRLALWSQWTRFDPRLGEILVNHVAQQWKQIHPARLNLELFSQPWPAVFGVILEQCELLFKSREKKQNSHLNHLFSHWSRCTMTDIQPARNEQFFIGVNAFAGRQVQKLPLRSIKAYSKWGYLGDTILINKYQKDETLTLPSLPVRQATMDGLMISLKKFTVNDYINALGRSINRRQAQRDLSTNEKLIAKGSTRGRYYLAR